jgi:D-alanine-D-alanine ligase
MDTPFPNARPSAKRVLFLREQDSILNQDAQVSEQSDWLAIQTALAQSGYTVTPVQLNSSAGLAQALETFDPRVSVVLNWYGSSDSKLQDRITVIQQLDALGFTYTGSNALVCHIAQDKVHIQRLMHACAIPAALGQPLAEENLGELRMTEPIEGGVFAVALWGNGTLEALPVIEMDFSVLPSRLIHMSAAISELSSTSQLHQAVGLSRELQTRIERVAKLAYRAVGLRDYGRVDIGLRGETPVVIDVNADPSIAPEGIFSAAAQLGGYDYSTMLSRIVQLAINRG